MPKASELLDCDYGIFYASAGHAALIDYPDATSLQRIAARVWTAGGIIATVCYGPAIFGGAGIRDGESNEHIIAGQTITGFTSEAEEVMGISSELKSWN
jgi:putative intracellular protease/amidase